MAVVEWWNFIAKKEQLLSISTTTICVVLFAVLIHFNKKHTFLSKSCWYHVVCLSYFTTYCFVTTPTKSLHQKSQQVSFFHKKSPCSTDENIPFHFFLLFFSNLHIFTRISCPPSGFHKFLSTLSLSCRKSHFTTHFRSISHFSQQNKIYDTQSRSLYYKWIGKRCCSILFFSSLFRCSHFLDILYWIATINRFTIVLTVDISNALQFFPTTRLVIESEQFGQIRYWHDSSESIPCFHKGKFIRR